MHFVHPAHHRRLSFATLAILAAALVSGGCHRSGAKSATEASSETRPARSEVERGPVRLTVEVKPSPARLSDEPVLTLTIDYEPGVTVRKPAFGESLGDFIIRDYHEPPLPRLANQREQLVQSYTLEPTVAGKIIVAPLVVTFTDNRENGDGKEHTIESEPITVEIVTAVGAQAPSLAALRPPAEAVPLPRQFRPIHWWTIVLLSVAAILAGIGWWRRRRKLNAPPPPTPRELASQELDALLAQHLADRDVKLFYVELTAVVRRYIERTTGIHAPEQTTEEFLREVSRRGTFANEEGRRLRSFLEAADLVKFAAHQPREGDVEESVHRARAFVGLVSTEVVA
jgi:hypothetical protein